MHCSSRKIHVVRCGDLLCRSLVCEGLLATATERSTGVSNSTSRTVLVQAYMVLVSDPALALGESGTVSFDVKLSQAPKAVVNMSFACERDPHTLLTLLA